DPRRSGVEAWRHPRSLGGAEVRSFLGHLATDRHVSASTQNQALNALVFLYAEVLHQPLGEIGEWARADRPKRLPVVLTRAEVTALFEAAEPDLRLPLQLLYGSGLRLFELLRLRVKDLNLSQNLLINRGGRGGGSDVGNKWLEEPSPRPSPTSPSLRGRGRRARRVALGCLGHRGRFNLLGFSSLVERGFTKLCVSRRINAGVPPHAHGSPKRRRTSRVGGPAQPAA
ncbi:MAG TPA: phage integrase N-terminal SAM-like domain-containing protein, partial [Verrucomicrobiota bacterium]|nr:phage integrase N-terminal SAM-like domain-containing protein [Verrucomicrobiota bacterium]